MSMLYIKSTKPLLNAQAFPVELYQSVFLEISLGLAAQILYFLELNERSLAFDERFMSPQIFSEVSNGFAEGTPCRMENLLPH